jgi:hypothetical protein
MNDGEGSPLAVVFFCPAAWCQNLLTGRRGILPRGGAEPTFAGTVYSLWLTTTYIRDGAPSPAFGRLFYWPVGP